MASDLFIDTGGFYSLLARKDDRHLRAREVMQKAAARKRRLVTTDYVLDETATLLRARGLNDLVPDFFEGIFASRACRVVWMDPERFDRTRALFLKGPGREWSFTDCLSFVVMKELHLREALTKDSHFREAGFTPLLS